MYVGIANYRFSVGGGENVPGIPGAFAYLVRDPLRYIIHAYGYSTENNVIILWFSDQKTHENMRGFSLVLHVWILLYHNQTWNHLSLYFGKYHCWYKLECGTWYHHPRRLQCVLSRNVRIFKVATWHYRCRHNLKNNCIWDNLQYCLLGPRSPSKPVMLTFDLQSRKVLFIEIVFWHV